MRVTVNIAPSRKQVRLLSGATLIEMLMASTLSLIAMSTLLTLVVEVSNEERRGLVDTTLQQQANLLQDKISQLVRSMSSSETVILGDPIATGSPFCRRVILARGSAPDFPREEIIFSPVTGKVIHDTDRSSTGDELTVFSPSVMARLRNMYFFAGIKSDGVADCSSLNIWMEFDDDGFARRHNPNGTSRRTQVVRSFTVKMRNN